METLDRIALIAETKEIIVNLYGLDGNSFSILGAIQGAMKKAKIPRSTIDAFFKEATSGDRQNLLKTCDLWVTLVHVAPCERSQSAIGAFREAGLDEDILQ